MGDRAMAEIKTANGSLFFYTHSHGYALPETAKTALETAQPRIGDDSYALRIVVDVLINLAGGRDREMGSGLMFSPNAEDEYCSGTPSVLIDLQKNRVINRRE